MIPTIGKIIKGHIVDINIISPTLRIGNTTDMFFSQYFRLMRDKDGNIVFFIRNNRTINTYTHLPVLKSGKIDHSKLESILTQCESLDPIFKSAWKHLENRWTELYMDFPQKIEKEVVKLKEEFMQYKKNQIIALDGVLKNQNSTTEQRQAAREGLKEITFGFVQYYNEQLHPFFCKEFSNCCHVNGMCKFDLELDYQIEQNLFGQEIELMCPLLQQLKVNRKDGKGMLQLKEYLGHLSEYFVHIHENVFPYMPVSFSNDLTEASLNYFDISNVDTTQVVETPAWNEFITKFPEIEQPVFMAFIYKIFNAKNKGKQALFLVDNGNTGKSTLLNALAKVLGPKLAQSMQKDSFSNQFSLAKIWNKRFIAIPDCKNVKILHTEKIHNILGNDTVEVEEKGEKSFSANLSCKMIIGMNDAPEIGGAAHEQTRAIILHPALPPALLEKLGQKDGNGKIERNNKGDAIILGDASFESKLINEFWDFLKKCRPHYEKLCPNNGNIILPIEMINGLSEYSSIDHDAFEDLFNLLEQGPDKFVKASELETWFSVHSKKEYRNFAEWVRKEKGIQKKNQRVDGKQTKVYIGIKPKPTNSFEQRV